jgi:uncharacterized protein YdeI (YjbR/CyaY-like superfamily)
MEVLMDPKTGTVIYGRAPKWQKEFEELRKIMFSLRLTEEMKWGWPCYSLIKKNIVLIHGFKDYCALLFFKGALINDPKKILIQQTENVQGARQIRFTNVQEIIKLKPVLITYVREAIKVEEAGLTINLKKTSDYKTPDEFQTKLDKLPSLRKAFHALTPGRQRAYIMYFSQPKQSKTRELRVEKSIEQILNGKGLND